MNSARISSHNANILDNLVLRKTRNACNRRLDRPRNVERPDFCHWIYRTSGILYDGNFPTIIPISTDDAKILGLKIPSSDCATINNERNFTTRKLENCTARKSENCTARNLENCTARKSENFTARNLENFTSRNLENFTSRKLEYCTARKLENCETRKSENCTTSKILPKNVQPATKRFKRDKSMNGNNNNSRGNGSSDDNTNNATKKKSKSKRETIDNCAGQRENLNSFQARLERGLRIISSKTAEYRRGKFKAGSSGKNVSSKLANVAANDAPAGEGKIDEITSIGSSQCEEDVGDKMRKRPSSRSMRQLFSMADSWSNDSVASHSNSCTCCVISESNRRQPPCPVHGASSSFAKK